MDEATIRAIVRDEIAKALRAAEIEGPHMARRVRIEVAHEVISSAVTEAHRSIAQGVRPQGRAFRI